MKKRIFLIAIGLVGSISLFTISKASQEVTWKETKTVEYSGNTKEVTIIWTDLKNELVTVETAIPSGGLGSVDSLEQIVLDQNDVDGTAIVGINGSFFNAYDDQQPAGTLFEEGEIRHIMESGSDFCIDGNNSVELNQLDITIYGGINGLWEWPNTWSAWGINHFSTNEVSTIIFDPEYGGIRPEHDFTGIVVENSVVTNIEGGTFDIPENGFLILTNDEEILGRINIGDTLDYKFEINGQDSNGNPKEEEISDYMTVVGAGPTLINNGEIVLDAIGEGFSEAKITTTKAQRSVIGVNADNELAMFTLSNVTLSEAATISQNIGLVKAINLDGGGSSGIYYDGGYVTTPSREISNAIIVRELKQPKIHVEINETEVFFDSLPFVDPLDNRTLVPLRKIAEALGSVVSYEAETKSIVITRYDTVIKLQVGSDIAYVNNKAMVMDTEVVIRNSRSFVPVRYITEYFGGDVDWDGDTKTVKLTIDGAEEYYNLGKIYEESGDYELALEQYQKAIEIDSTRVDAIKRIAYIYNVELEDKESSIEYYERALAIEPEDIYTLNSYAWVQFGLKNYDTALELFESYIELNPDYYAGYYGVALINENWRVDNQDKAREYFELALAKNPPDYVKDYINAYLEN